ncbi:hypothetical protein [Prosthecobacter vanneervenii]|uniref:Uncharacterized protein n=1 Tax=Prosthecobacter vanneervenii TaxID=48466 RepID=A0A7W8DIY7_9BACT|nr:hypothetical protein [Prosthecobacter vanneervenii]MBB5031460.1 hypothetical protein [Prosthecobacter vanneervenii]
MKPSFEPLVLPSHPDVGDLHPLSPLYKAVEVRIIDSADIEGKVVYAGPRSWQVEEAFVVRPAAA